MARSAWKGAIAFGLVNIPVGLTSAESRPDIQLHMVDSENHARIRYERVNADTGDEVPWDRMVKGYEHEDGKFILLTEEDLQAVQPKLTKTIEIASFVSLDDIDPILLQTLLSRAGQARSEGLRVAAGSTPPVGQGRNFEGGHPDPGVSLGDVCPRRRADPHAPSFPSGDPCLVEAGASCLNRGGVPAQEERDEFRVAPH